MDESQLAALYQQYLGRAPDPSGIATWSGQDPASVIAGITGSQEYANNQAAQSGGGGGGGGGSAPSFDTSTPEATLASIYQNVLGRAPDAGSSGWLEALRADGSPQDIAQQIANSAEGKKYAAANPSGQFSALAALSQTDNPYKDSPELSNLQYIGLNQFKDQNGGIISIDPDTGTRSYSPGPSWYQEQYAAHPDAIRSGWQGQQYLAAGPLAQTYKFNGTDIPINATEYRIDPTTKGLTQSPVMYEPDTGGFGNWMADNGWMLPLAMAGGAAAAEFLPAMFEGAAPLGTTFEGLTPAQQLLYSGAVADSTTLTPGASAILNGTAATLPSGAAATAGGLGTIGSGYAGIGLNPAIQTGGEFAYSGMGLNPAITGSSGVGLNATIPGITSGLATDAASLAAASGVPIDAATFGGYGALTASEAYALDAALTAAEAAGTGLTLSSLAKLAPSLLSKAIGALTGSGSGGSTTGSGLNLANLLGGSGTGKGNTNINMNQSPKGTLVQGSQIASPLAASFNVPVENILAPQFNAQATQDLIKNAAEGGEIRKMNTGGLMPMTEVRNRGRQLGLAPTLAKSNLPILGHRTGGEVQGHNPSFFSPGGLASMSNTYVEGEGDGTSDSVEAMLADGEFVIPADVVSKLGNGSSNAGARVLDEFLSTIREHAQNHDPKSLPPNSKGTLAYLSEAKRKADA